MKIYEIGEDRSTGDAVQVGNSPQELSRYFDFDLPEDKQDTILKATREGRCYLLWGTPDNLLRRSIIAPDDAPLLDNGKRECQDCCWGRIEPNLETVLCKYTPVIVVKDPYDFCHYHAFTTGWTPATENEDGPA